MVNGSSSGRFFHDVNISGNVLKAVLDTGSDVNFIHRDLVKTLKLHELKSNVNLFMANGSIHYRCNFVNVRMFSGFEKFFVFDQSSHQLVFGWPLIRKHQLLIASDYAVTANVSQDFHVKWDELNISNKVSSKQKNQLLTLLQQFPSVFSRNQFDFSSNSLFKHDIDTGSHLPFRCRDYPIPYSQKENASKIIDDMLQNGIIRESSSPWRNPIFFIKKKDGRLQLVVDFRRLNSISSDSCFPLPLIDECITELGGCQYFTTLDLTSAYYQVALSEDAKPKTAFAVNNCLYEFNRMPYGLKNAPALFQRMMQVVLKNLGILPYIDDIIIANKNFDEHLRSIKNVLQRLNDVNLKVKPGKCLFAFNEVKYLGFIVSENGIKPDPEKVAKLKSMNVPQNSKEVDSFCGFANFMSRFIPYLAGLLKPIYATKSGNFVWSSEAQVSFDRIKEIISQRTLLNFPDFTKPFIIECDASSVALGAVLKQDDFPLMFCSRVLSKSEMNYSVTDREFLALVWAIKKFRQYVYGHRFVVRVDHEPLIHLVKKPPGCARHARYINFLEDFDFQVDYINGSENVMADVMSRLVPTDIVSSNSPVSSTVTSRVIVPDDEIQNIIQEHHEFGHYGITRTRFSILNAGLYFPNMREKIRSFISTCSACLRFKSFSYTTKKGRIISEKLRNFELISVDLVGPLRPSKGNHRFILTMIDVKSRFAQAFPVHDTSADHICKLIEDNWIYKFGIPRAILCDNGPQFISLSFRDLARKHGYYIKHSTIYYPKGNSVVERFHRELKDTIACLNGDWKERLPRVVAAHNSAFCSPINSSPYQLIFGRKFKDNFSSSRNSTAITNFIGRCPKFVCFKIVNRRPLSPRYSDPISVKRRISEQVVETIDGKLFNLNLCKVIW